MTTPLQSVNKRELMQFTAPIQELGWGGAAEIERYIFDAMHIDFSMTMVGMKQVDDIEYDEFVLRGRLINRIEQLLYHRYDYDVTDEQHIRLSAIIAQHMIGSENLRFFDVVDYIRWKPGSFGEYHDSCWWTSQYFRQGKDLVIKEMKRGEAVAVRLFRPASIAERAQQGLKKWYGDYIGVGRCFALVNNPIGVDLMFNTYGLNPDQWQNLMQTIFGYEHAQRVGLSLHKHIFVNRASAVALSNQSINIKVYRQPNFGTWSPYVCQNCGLKTRSGNDQYRSRQLCKKCYNHAQMRQLQRPAAPEAVVLQW